MSRVNLTRATSVNPNQARDAAGFTLIELVVVIIVVSLLAATAVDRLFYYQERAEKAVMEATLAAFKMGLQIRLAELSMTNRGNHAAELEQQNPVRWLNEPPSNYAGDYHAPAERGSWTFATDSHELIYVPQNTNYLSWEQADQRELRFQVRLRYEEIEHAGGKLKAPAGVVLISARPYSWF